MKKIVFIILILLTCSIVHSQNDRWKYVYSDSYSNFYIDSESIIAKANNTIFEVYVRAIFFNQQDGYQEFHEIYYCDDRKVDIISSFVYNENGFHKMQDAKYNLTIPPESINEVIFNYLCKRK